MNDFAAPSAHSYYRSIYRYVRRRVSNTQEAEDITQDVFEAAAVALAKEKVEAEPELAWLYTVAERRLIRAWRRRVSTEPFDESQHPAATSIDPAVYTTSLLDAVVAGTKQLPEAQRQVVVAKLFEGRTFAEIASKSGITEEACRQRLSRGLAQLRDELRSRGVTP